MQIPHLPEGVSPEKPYLLEFDVKHQLNNFLGASVCYTIVNPLGQQVTGVVPEDGVICVYASKPDEKMTVLVYENENQVSKEDK